jgi:hypothetical protein
MEWFMTNTRPSSKLPISPLRAGVRSKPTSNTYLLGSMYERVGPNGERHFYGFIAGMKYVMTPARSKKSESKGERRWNLHVQPAESSPINSASERTRKSE